MSMQLQRPEENTGYLLLSLSTLSALLPLKGHSLNRKSAIWGRGWLARKLLESSCLCPFSARDANAHVLA